MNELNIFMQEREVLDFLGMVALLQNSKAETHAGGF